LYQYVANVQTPRYALESSYTIYLFHNDPATEDPAEWVLDSNLIGPIGVLASSNMNSDLLIVNSVPLTRTLSDQVAAGALPSLAEALVVPYLEQSLKWRIVGSSGSIIDPDSLDGFLVSVYASTASQPASDSELPTWSAFIPLAQITENKAGGADPSTIINGTASALTR
jgi:tyrosinase